ncbi:MAG: hypothetical protein ACYCOU_07520 [Sulfobacillus sp.]
MNGNFIVNVNVNTKVQAQDGAGEALNSASSNYDQDYTFTLNGANTLLVCYYVYLLTSKYVLKCSGGTPMFYNSVLYVENYINIPLPAPTTVKNGFSLSSGSYLVISSSYLGALIPVTSLFDAADNSIITAIRPTTDNRSTGSI